MYPVEHCENLQFPIQMQLCEKRKTFSEIANVFPKLETVKIMLRPLSKERHLRTRFDSQHLKAFQILAKSPWEHFYPNF